jgi:hypothetical protein
LLLLAGKLALLAKRISSHAKGPKRTIKSDALADLRRAPAAAVETLLPNSLEGILHPEFQGENIGRHVAGMFAYQLAFVSLIWRYFEEVAAFHLGGPHSIAGSDATHVVVGDFFLDPADRLRPKLYRLGKLAIGYAPVDC